MDPVGGIWDVLDVGVGEQPLDLWVILRAGSRGRRKTQGGTGKETKERGGTRGQRGGERVKKREDKVDGQERKGD